MKNPPPPPEPKQQQPTIDEQVEWILTEFGSKFYQDAPNSKIKFKIHDVQNGIDEIKKIFNYYSKSIEGRTYESLHDEYIECAERIQELSKALKNIERNVPTNYR